MNAFMLLALPAFMAETKVFQHTLIRPATNKRVRFVVLSQYFSKQNKGLQHVLIRPVEMSACSVWRSNPQKMDAFIVALSISLQKEIASTRVDKTR